MKQRVKGYHPTKGASSGALTPSKSRGGNMPYRGASASDCARAASRGGKDIIAVGTIQPPAFLAAPGPWAFTFDIAEDCRLARLIIQVSDPAGTTLDASSQIVTALTHNNDRLLSGAQITGAMFDYAAQPGTNPTWGRNAIVSDQVTIAGASIFPAACTVSVTLSTM